MGVQAQAVVLYSSNNAETIAIAVGASKKKQADLQIKSVTGGTGTLLKRIKAEAANPVADIFWSGGVGTLAAFPEVMEPYESPDAKAIAPQFRDSKGRYIGVNLHVMVLIVNEKMLRGLPAPKTWSDLMKPEWKGKFAVTDPSKSGTAFIQVYGLLKQFGRDGLEKITSNAVVVHSSGQVSKSVVAGEYPVGITTESSVQGYINDGHKEIKMIYPNEGTYLGAEGMFLVKGAKNARAAKQLYDLLLSKPVQQSLLVEKFRRPTRSDIAVSKLTGLPDLANLKVFPLSLQVATEEYEQLIALWNLTQTKARR